MNLLEHLKSKLVNCCYGYIKFGLPCETSATRCWNFKNGECIGNGSNVKIREYKSFTNKIKNKENN